MKRYFMSPRYWIKLAVTFIALSLIRKYAHGDYLFQGIVLVLIWGFNPERYLLRLVRRMF